MVAIFLIVLGIVGGFFLALLVRQWLEGCEARERARIARERAREEESSSATTKRSPRRRK